jgi:phage tail sheath gpL-like
MAISFNQIPSNLRVPIAYFEIDPSQAASYSNVTYALMLGTHDPARGPLQIGVLTRVRSKFDAEGLCGVGSALARMCAAYFANNQSVPLFILAADETGFAAAAGSFTVDGSAIEGGTLPLYIGGRPVRVYLTAGMTTAQVLDAIEGAVNADPAIGVTALANPVAPVPTSAILAGGPVNGAAQAALVATLRGIADGGFTISVGGVARDTGGIDFGTITTLPEAATLITAALGAGLIATWFTNHFIVSTLATGPTAQLSFASPSATAATDISATLLLTAASGATLTQGTDGTSALAGTVAITSNQPGLHGALDLDVAFRGPAYGEIVPLGLTVTATPMIGMAGVPDVSALVANLGDELYDYICSPWNDATSLDDLSNLLQDVTGRWSWSQQLYGHAFAFRADTLGALSTFGNTRNDQHVTLAGWFGSPTPECEIAAAWTGQVAGSVVVDPARPVQTLPLLGVVPPRPDDRFQILDRQVLYFDGIACGYVDSGGVMRIDRSITTYQKNVWGAPDNSYLDVETLYTLADFNRFMRNRILLKFPRHKLADDGTRFGAGQAIVTPLIIRSEMIAAYGELEEAGKMENMEAFKANLIVERNAQDPNRVDALLPPDLVNQLRIFAALTQFRLRSVSVEAA